MKLEQSAISNCFPFAPKYCHLPISEMSGELRLHTFENDITKPNVPLILGADLDFLLSQISKDIDIPKISSNKENSEIASGNIKMDDPKFTSQTSELENFWDDDGDWFDEPLNQNDNPKEEEDTFENQNSDSSPNFWLPKPIDTLAVYKPAHFADEDEYGYGIAFKKDAFLNSVVPYINALPSDTTGTNFQTKLLGLIIYHVFAHEVCHSWVEDIVSMVDFEMGVGSGEPNTYPRAQQKFGGFIAREEAVCETAAYGWVHDCLKKSLSKNGVNNKDEIQKLKKEYKNWLTKSTSKLIGYKDYCKRVVDAPVRNQKFIKGLGRLISTRYLNRDNSELCRKVIENYFAGKICRTNRKYLNNIKPPTPGTSNFAKLATAHWLKVVPRWCE